MNQKEFCRQLASMTPEVPEHFSRHVDGVLERIVRQEESNMKESTKRAIQTGSRVTRRTLILALAALLLVGSVAFAASQWGIADRLGWLLGRQEVHQDAQLQQILHQEIVNDVEITVYEAGYDGRTLFLQYGYRMLDETEPLGKLDANGRLQSCITDEALEKLYSHNVGWWVDHFWINGMCMDMAGDSGSDETGTLVPGEIMRTEYWRLDNLDVFLSGEVSIALPIGECQPLIDYNPQEHPERFDKSGHMLQPDKGVVCFTFNAGDTLSKVMTLHPNVETVTPILTAKVSEAAFTPMMTYITLAMETNPDALAAYKAEHGEGYYDENGNLIYAFTGMELNASYLWSLDLVDGHGQRIFPDYHGGYNGSSDQWAEFLYPYIAQDSMPDELWLAPIEGDTADMSCAIRVK